MTGYLLNEHLIRLSDNQVYIWNNNLSSHQDSSHYGHRVYDLKTQSSVSLNQHIFLPAPDLGDLYTDLPESLQLQLKAQMAHVNLPPRTPRQVWYCSEQKKLIFEYLWQAPKSVLRILDLEACIEHSEDSQDSAPFQDHHYSDLNIRALSQDGRSFFASAYPGNQQFYIQSINQETATVTKTWPFKNAYYLPGTIFAQGLYWVSLKVGRTYQLIALDQLGATQQEIKLKGRPEEMYSDEQGALVLGCGNSEILLLQCDQENNLKIQKIKYPQPRLKDNALRSKLSPDGRYLAVYGTLDQQLSVIRLRDLSLIDVQDLSIFEHTLANGDLLLKRPDFLPTNQGILTLQNGMVKRTALN